PPGGRFIRDALGELTGLLQGRAAGVVRGAVRREGSPPEAETIAGYQECFRQYLRRGMTTVQVAGTSPSSAALLARARTDELPLRFYVMFTENSLEEAGRRKREGGPADGLRFG